MKSVRHWKQVFDKDADFIFLRRVRLAGNKFSEPGDDVPDSLLGKHRLRARVWWKAGLIGLKSWDYDKGRPTAPEGVQALGKNRFRVGDQVVYGHKGLREALSEKKPEKVQPKPVEEKVEKLEMKHTGGGWYLVGDQKIRGKANAKKLLEELQGT